MPTTDVSWTIAYDPFAVAEVDLWVWTGQGSDSLYLLHQLDLREPDAWHLSLSAIEAGAWRTCYAESFSDAPDPADGPWTHHAQRRCDAVRARIFANVETFVREEGGPWRAS